MALSKKKRVILIVSSITVGSIILLLGIILVLVKNYNSTIWHSDYGYIDSKTSISNEGFSPQSIGEDLDYSRSMELDSSNYDEANLDSKIRKSGNVNIIVDDLDSSNDEVLDVLDGYNGSVVSSYQSGRGNSKSISLTIKVPVENFEDIYQDIQGLDGEVEYASYYTDDVTMEYTDLESRLKNLEATENQLVKILETADTVEDTLAVYNQLSTTRSQIEVIKGQLKYLDSQVDYSYLTINLSLSDIGKDVKDEKWQPFGVLKNAIASLVDFTISIVDALIWVFVFSPVILIPAFIIKAIVKKRSKKEEKMV
jgi:uncharacterized lipoprotein YehR (DUF1307 family)